MTELTAIKGRFKASEQKVFGLFFLILNNESSFVDTAGIIASIHSEIYDTDLSDSFHDFENRITMLKYKGNYHQKVTLDLQDTLKSVALDQEFYEDLKKSAAKGNKNGVKHSIVTLISRVLHDSTVIAEVSLEDVTHEQVKAANSTPAEEPVQADSAPKTDGVTLDVSLVLAPVGGKLVTDLSPGDRIMVRIAPSSDKSEYFIDLLNLRGEKGVKPVAAKVVSLDEGSGVTSVRVQIDDGVFGKVSEEEKVLVRLAEETSDTAGKKPSSKSSSKKPSATTSKPRSIEKRSGILFKVALGVAVMLLLLVFFLLSV